MRPVASRSLFFDVQVLTLLSEKYTLFARANLCYPTTRLCSYFSTIYAAHLRENTRTIGCKRSLIYQNLNPLDIESNGEKNGQNGKIK